MWDERFLIQNLIFTLSQTPARRIQFLGAFKQTGKETEVADNNDGVYRV